MVRDRWLAVQKQTGRASPAAKVLDAMENFRALLNIGHFDFV